MTRLQDVLRQQVRGELACGVHATILIGQSGFSLWLRDRTSGSIIIINDGGALITPSDEASEASGARGRDQKY